MFLVVPNLFRARRLYDVNVEFPPFPVIQNYPLSLHIYFPHYDIYPHLSWHFCCVAVILLLVQSVYFWPLSTVDMFRLPLPQRIFHCCIKHPTPQMQVQISYRTPSSREGLEHQFNFQGNRACLLQVLATTRSVSFHFHQISYQDYLWRRV